MRPNVRKLMEARDVDGLRAALRYADSEVRHDAIRALGWIELPPSASERRSHRYTWFGRGARTKVELPPVANERQGVVPQEAVADLEACWRQPELDISLVGDALEAMARIGGRAGVEALLRSIAELDGRHQLHRFNVNQLLCQLGVDELIGILRDETRPAEVRAAVSVALQSGVCDAGASVRATDQEARVAEAVALWHLVQEARWATEEEAKRRRIADAEAFGERWEQFTRSTEPSAPEAAFFLSWMYDRSPYPGGGFAIEEAPAAPVRDIGSRLHECGGLRLMREAHAQFAALRPGMGRNLEMVWDGIGSWSG